MTIPVVFGVDKNFVMPLKVALVSLLDNKNSGTKYDIYILHSNDLNNADILQLKSTLKNNNDDKINFVPMGDAYSNVSVNPIWTKAILYRLSIHEILPNVYGRCIYCDCDIIVNCDLQGLFQENIDEYYLAGARDPVICYSNYREMFPDPDKYINSGVLLINLKKWRDMHIEDLFDKYIFQNFRYPDQDILNLACRDNILFLEDEKYVLSGILNRNKYSDVRSAIVHYCGLIKPWDVSVSNPFFELWVHYANKALINLKDLSLEEKRNRIHNYIEINRIHEIIIWGMAASTLDVCFFLEEFGLEIAAIGDNNQQKVVQGNRYYKMIGAEDISINKDYNYLVVAVNYYAEIKKQLMLEGVLEEKIMSWNEFKQLMSCEVMKE